MWGQDDVEDFIRWLLPTKDGSGWDNAELRDDAPETAKKAYAEYHRQLAEDEKNGIER
jgi:hypothetical protein